MATLADALQRSGVSFFQLATNFISSLKSCLQAEQSTFLHDSAIQYAEALRWVIRDLKGDCVCSVGESIVRDVLLPYLILMSTETIQMTPPSLRAVGQIVAECLCQSVLGVDVARDVMLPILTCLGTSRPLQLQTRFQCGGKPITGEDLNPWVVLVMFEQVLQKEAVRMLAEVTGGEETIVQLSLQLLHVLSTVSAACCQLMASSILPSLIIQASVAQQVVGELWALVEAVRSGKQTTSCDKTRLVHTLLCCFSDLYIGADRSSPFISSFSPVLVKTVPLLDLRKQDAFFVVIQEGLVSSDPLARKRCRYLLHRVFLSTEGLDKVETSSYTFWWCERNSILLKPVWSDLILMLDTLEEKAVHIVQPTLIKLKSLARAVNTEIDGHSLLHFSWLEIVFTQVFQHEAKTIIKLGVKGFLDMPILVPCLNPKHWQFLFGPLLAVLKHSAIYERDASEPSFNCPVIVQSLITFLKHFVLALSEDQRGAFLSQLILACLSQKLVDVPLVYFTYAFSLLPPMSVVNSSSLAAVRSLLHGGLITVKASLREAVQCFFLTAICTLIDLPHVSYNDVFHTLGCFSGSECLVYGSPCWQMAVNLVKELNALSGQTQPVISFLRGLMQESLKESTSVSTMSPISMCRAVLLTLCAFDACNESFTLEAVVADLIDPLVALVVSAPNRPYLAYQVVHNATEQLVGIMEMLSGQDKSGDVKVVLYKYLSLWLPGLLVHFENQLLRGSPDGSVPDLNHTLFYKQALYHFYTFASGICCINTTSLMDRASTVLEQTERSVELTCEFLGAITAMALLCTLPGSDMGSSLRVLSVPVIIIKPKASITWETQPDWGFLMRHCYTAYWECVQCVLRDFGPGGFQGKWSPDVLAQTCMDNIDMIQDNLSILLSSLTFLVTKLDPVVVSNCADQFWPVLVQYKSAPIFNDALKSFISFCYNPLLDSCQHPLITAMQCKYTNELASLGEVKSGVYLLFLEHLCSNWMSYFEKDPDLAIQCLTRHISVIIDAVSFGPIFKKNLRLIEDAEHFIKRLEHKCFTDRFMKERQCSNKDCCVRINILNLLLKLACHQDHARLRCYFTNLYIMMATKLLQMSKDHPKYYINSYIHRLKLRLCQAMLVLISWIDKSASNQIGQLLLQCLQYDNQVSVRYLIDWMAVLLFCQYPELLGSLLYPCLQQNSGVRFSRMSSIFTIVLHVGRNLPDTEFKTQYSLYIIKALLSWCSNNHFTVRIYAQNALFSMWDECPKQVREDLCLLNETIQFIKEASTSTGTMHKLEDNVFFTHIRAILDLNIQTIYQIVPQLTGVLEEEWVHMLKEFSDHSDIWQSSTVYPMSLFSSNTSLLKLTERPVKMMCDNKDLGESSSGDLQRKISLMEGLGVVDELFPSSPVPIVRQGPTNGLILVASLIHKVPNLGGLCRTCEVFGVSELVVDNLSILEDKEFQSLSVTADKWLSISEVKVETLPKYLSEKRQDGYFIVGIEQTVGSSCVTNYQFKHKTMLILGNEREGIPVQLIHLLDECIEVPQFGIIRSLNVHVSGAIVIWEYVKQHMCL